MPPQTNVYAAAPQVAPSAAKSKGFLGFFRAKVEDGHDWTTVRTFGSSKRRTARLPVLE
ncbi:hypothetical protein [Caulobacter segnis]|uniref:hypothetical protein n=1 Tax=Caulobacter segnis TaxID=88688 RepID=UPI0026B08A98|nr:hypothetical protein [Caulobacter segnis]